MNTLKKSAVKRLDKDLVSFYFDAKAFGLESLYDHTSGAFSTQQKLEEMKNQLLDFIMSYKNTNSIFMLFHESIEEHNLKIVVNSLEGEPDHLTKRFVVLINGDLSDMQISQLPYNSSYIVT